MLIGGTTSLIHKKARMNKSRMLSMLMFSVPKDWPQRVSHAFYQEYGSFGVTKNFPAGQIFTGQIYAAVLHHLNDRVRLVLTDLRHEWIIYHNNVSN